MSEVFEFPSAKIVYIPQRGWVCHNVLQSQFIIIYFFTPTFVTEGNLSILCCLTVTVNGDFFICIFFFLIFSLVGFTSFWYLPSRYLLVILIYEMLVIQPILCRNQMITFRRHQMFLRVFLGSWRIQTETSIRGWKHRAPHAPFSW